MTWLRDSNTHLNKSEQDNSKSDKSALLAEYFKLQSSFNTQEFIETLVEDGMDNNTIIDFVKQQEALSQNLYEFMHEAVKHCWMGKSWTPQQIREKGVELGLMIKKEECVYAYSDELKKHFG
jgi:predicted CoA-binding protein